MSEAVLSHAGAARVHAARRAWQRCGLAVAKPDLLEAERQIWSGEAVWVSDGIRGPHLCQIYSVRLKGKRVPVVFNISLETIVTVLPRRALTRG